MSKAICCDRCGQTQPINRPFSSKENYVPSEWLDFNLSYDVNTDRLEHCSLCPTCTKALRTFMVELKK